MPEEMWIQANESDDDTSAKEVRMSSSDTLKRPPPHLVPRLLGTTLLHSHPDPSTLLPELPGSQGPNMVRFGGRRNIW